MTRTKPLQILVYQDVLCAWCYVADARLDVLRAELGDSVRWLSRPFPLRASEGVPSARERDEFVRELARAKLEPEGARLIPDVWSGDDPPRTSITALAAVEAAKLQGAEACARMTRALRHAALELGVNVARPDVVYELASAQRLQMNRFNAAFQSPETRRLILEEHRIATERGVKGVPTLVIGGRWMLSGLREVAEYREEILRCMGKVEHRRMVSSERVLH